MRIFGFDISIARGPRKNYADDVILMPTIAGPAVNENTALTYSAVFACTKVVSETVAGLPWHVRERVGDSKIINMAHPVDWLLNQQPNPEMDAFAFKCDMGAHALLWGNAYAEIERNNGGIPIALWLVTPDRVKIMRDDEGELFYRVTGKFNEYADVPQEDMLHIKGLGFDGRKGYSVIKLGRESVGLGKAMENYGGAFFKNDATPGIALQHPGKLTPKAQEFLEKQLNKKFTGARNHKKTMILQEGIELKTYAIPPEQAQFLGSRKFQIAEIARWFRCPLHKLADLERATFSNIEHQSLEFVTDTIVPWVQRWEQEANRKLFPTTNRTFFTKMEVKGLLRGDIKTRTLWYKTGWAMGIFTINEIRMLEDMNPIGADGDVRFVPRNMTTLENAIRGATEPATQGSQINEIYERSGVLKEAMMPVVREAIARMMRKESKAVSKAIARYAKDPQRFMDWIGDFYQKHEKELGESLAPATRTMGELLLSPDIAEAFNFSAWCADSKAIFADLYNKSAEEEQINRICEIREKDTAQTRAEEFIKAIIGGKLNAVQSKVA